jgi:hypothetical protein
LQQSNPEHAAAIFKKFYAFDGLSNALSLGICAVQSVFIIRFVSEDMTASCSLIFRDSRD